MDFSDALNEIKRGHRVTRDGWNGKGMYLFLVPGSTFTVEASRPMGKASPELVGSQVNYRPHIDMKTADGEMVPWVASQSDLLVSDWRVV